MLIKFFFVLNFAFLKIATSLNVSQYASATIWERFLADFLKIQDLERCTLSIQVQPGSNFYLSKLLSGQSSRGHFLSNKMIEPTPSSVACKVAVISTAKPMLKNSFNEVLRMIEHHRNSFYLLTLESDSYDSLENVDDIDCIPNVLLAKRHLQSSVKIFSISGFSNPKSGLFVSNLTNVWRQESGFLMKSMSQMCGVSTRRTLRVAHPTVGSTTFFGIGSCVELGKICGSDVLATFYIATSLNVDLQFFPSIDGNWGGLVDVQKNTFNGMIGMVQRKEVDLAIGSITITDPRSKVIDFTVPYYETSAGYMANIPRELSKWASLLRPYQANAWFPILVTVCISGPFGYLMYKASSFHHLEQLTVAKISLVLYQIFINQDVRIEKVSGIFSLKCYIVTWCLFSFIVTSAYIGSLISSLSKPTLAPPLETFKEILDKSSSLVIMIQTATSSEQYMKLTNNTVLREVEKLIAKRGTGYQDVEEAIGIVMKNEDTALILDEAYFKMMVQPPSQEKSANEDIYFSEETFLPSGYGFVTIKGSKYRDIINKLIWRFREFGLYNRWLLMADLERRERNLKTDSNSNHTIQAQRNVDSTERKLTKFTLSHLQGIFYIFGILMAVIIIVFVFETGFQKRKLQETNQTNRNVRRLGGK